VFVEYQRWQQELDRQPVELLARRYDELIGDARAALAAYVGARPDDLVFVPNATTAVFYTGNCHKWLCAPKGAGFLWVREELQARTDPLVVSWGWPEDDFAKRHGWQGTRDPAAWLAVPAAIEFQRANGWDAVRGRSHELLVGFLEASGLEPVGRPFVQMVAAYLPPCDPADVQRSLLEEYAIEVPCFEWNGRPLIRVSVQGYNEPADVDRLVSALEGL
jgi:isopenicillin-N epimerase